ncbi:MAG: SMR family transporter [Betaproteobacteria bacterium]
MGGLTPTSFAFLFSGVLLNAGAQLLLKAGTNTLGVISLTRDNWLPTLWRMAHTGPFIFGVACYGVSLITWIIGLSRVPVSVAYPLLSLGYIVNAIAAHYLFGEAVTPMRWLGIGFVIVGVFLIARPA